MTFEQLAESTKLAGLDRLLADRLTQLASKRTNCRVLGRDLRQELACGVEAIGEQREYELLFIAEVPGPFTCKEGDELPRGMEVMLTVRALRRSPQAASLHKPVVVIVRSGTRAGCRFIWAAGRSSASAWVAVLELGADGS